MSNRRHSNDPIRTLHKAGWSAEVIAQRLMRNLDEIQAILAASEDSAPRNGRGQGGGNKFNSVNPHAKGLLRKQNAVAAFHGSTRDKAMRWNKGMLRLLGKATDRHLAQRFGLHFGTVGKMRRSLNIPAYCRRPARS